MATEKEQLPTGHVDHEENEDLGKIGTKNQDGNPSGPVLDENWHATSRRVVRKLDMTLMPIIWVLYLFNYLDRTSIA